MFALAGPVVLAELAWTTMSLVDTFMVGRVGPAAIGAVGLGNILFFTVGICGMGLLLGLDTLISHAFGARRIDECHRCLLHGVYLSLVLAPLLMGCIWGCLPLVYRMGIHPDVLVLMLPCLKALTWSMLPLLLYASFRRYLQAMNHVRPVMFALVTANLINLFGNWVLIYGHLGFRAMGAEGSGWATCWARVYMAGVLIVYAVMLDRHEKSGLFRISFRPDLSLFRRLLGLGLPASAQLLLEVGVFGAATALAARITPVALAAHEIALNIASATYMVPLGVSAAGAVRVGQALGRKDTAGAQRAGWTALAFGAGFMTLAGIALLIVPGAIYRPFTPDARVIAAGVPILFVVALVQLFDGSQVVATGVLRGLGNTRTPMITNLAGHWFLGLPVGYVLTFLFGWGVVGLWIGLSVGLAVVGIVLVSVWARSITRARAMDRPLDLAEATISSQ
jgi:MATE family multidrug resistance protein